MEGCEHWCIGQAKSTSRLTESCKLTKLYLLVLIIQSKSTLHIHSYQKETK